MLGQPLLEDWHAWHVNDQVEGYAITYENLQFVTFKGGWHTGTAPIPATGRWLGATSDALLVRVGPLLQIVPESNPAGALLMLEKFYNNEPL